MNLAVPVRSVPVIKRQALPTAGTVASLLLRMVMPSLPPRKKDSSGTTPDPDSDPKGEKPNPKSLREKSGRKPGGQRGYKGSTTEFFSV